MKNLSNGALYALVLTAGGLVAHEAAHLLVQRQLGGYHFPVVSKWDAATDLALNSELEQFGKLEARRLA